MVAFDVGGISEIVVNNKTGLLADSKDPIDLAEKMQKLVTDNSLCLRLGRECRNYAINNFSMETYANAYVQLFSNSVS